MFKEWFFLFLGLVLGIPLTIITNMFFQPKVERWWNSLTEKRIKKNKVRYELLEMEVKILLENPFEELVLRQRMQAFEILCLVVISMSFVITFALSVIFIVLNNGALPKETLIQASILNIIVIAGFAPRIDNPNMRWVLREVDIRKGRRAKPLKKYIKPDESDTPKN